MDASPLARLPAELRTYIYELALTKREPIPLPTWSRGRRLQRFLRQVIGSHALSQTCHQIRHERNALLFWSVNTFTFTRTIPEDLHNAFLRFYTNLPTDCVQAMRSVKLHLTRPLCLCYHCQPLPKFLRPHMRRLVEGIRQRSLVQPRCRFVLRAALCYSAETPFELPIGGSPEPWDRAIEFAGLEVHRQQIVYDELREYRWRVQGQVQKHLRELRDIALGVAD